MTEAADLSFPVICENTVNSIDYRQFRYRNDFRQLATKPHPPQHMLLNDVSMLGQECPLLAVSSRPEPFTDSIWLQNWTAVP